MLIMMLATKDISIHVPLAGHDHIVYLTEEHMDLISIHVPLAGHDVIAWELGGLLIFQSTCPLRGTTRLARYCCQVLKEEFQSTCPLRGTTAQYISFLVTGVISIHVPLAGHDG